MVDITVTVAQGLTLFILAAWMADLIEAIMRLQDGYHPELLTKYPGATFSTWLVSCLAQLSAGLFLLVGTFILTMQASTVFKVMLNIKTLIFMALIDDLGFGMAKKGFVTDTLQEEARAVGGIQVKKRKCTNLYRRLLYLLALIGLYTGYAMLKNRQLDGHYLPTNVYVQFGDAYNSKIPYFSGIMSSGEVRTNTYREYRDKTENVLLSYCAEARAWTFAYGDDPCDYFARSYTTDSYDVTSIHDSQWEVRDELSRLLPFTHFSLVGRDCNSNTCQGTCGENGLCQCPPNQFGMDCEFSDVCAHIRIDERLASFPPQTIYSDYFESGFESVAISDEFVLLTNPNTGEPVKVYNMPVYYSNTTWPASVIFFGGRRFIITTEWDLIDIPALKEKYPDTWYFREQTVAALENNFHAYNEASYTPFYISDPVDYETPDFHPTPNDLKWWSVKKPNETQRTFVPDTPVETMLRLGCMDTPPSCIGQPADFCLHGGRCNLETGRCDCAYEDEGIYGGDRCEYIVSCADQAVKCGRNGLCNKDSGECRCNAPYYGKLCHQTYKCYEEGGTCRNGGVCNIISGECDCPEDYSISGGSCEKHDDCFYFGCANGGHCGQYGRCHCQPPFHGNLCDLVDESQEEYFCYTDDDCSNGTCNMNTGLCDCEDPGTYGSLCEHRFNCTSRPAWAPSCLNAGTCNDSTGVCECPEPYFGPDCSQKRACLDDSHCGMGACDAATGQCICEGGLAAGGFCEIDRGICETDDDCHYGVCDREWLRCECPWGHSGWFCQQWAADPSWVPYWEGLHDKEAKGIERCGFDGFYNRSCMEPSPTS